MAVYIEEPPIRRHLEDKTNHSRRHCLEIAGAKIRRVRDDLNASGFGAQAVIFKSLGLVHGTNENAKLMMIDK